MKTDPRDWGRAEHWENPVSCELLREELLHVFGRDDVDHRCTAERLGEDGRALLFQDAQVTHGCVVQCLGAEVGRHQEHRLLGLVRESDEDVKALVLFVQVDPEGGGLQTEPDFLRGVEFEVTEQHPTLVEHPLKFERDAVRDVGVQDVFRELLLRRRRGLLGLRLELRLRRDCFGGADLGLQLEVAFELSEGVRDSGRGHGTLLYVVALLRRSGWLIGMMARSGRTSVSSSFRIRHASFLGDAARRVGCEVLVAQVDADVGEVLVGARQVLLVLGPFAFLEDAGDGFAQRLRLAGDVDAERVGEEAVGPEEELHVALVHFGLFFDEAVGDVLEQAVGSPLAEVGDVDFHGDRVDRVGEVFVGVGGQVDVGFGVGNELEHHHVEPAGEQSPGDRRGHF